MGTCLHLQRTAPRQTCAFSLQFLAVAVLQAPAQTDGSIPLADQEFLRKLSAAAIERTHHSVRYVSDYVRIPYPGGDIPADTGVCTNEVIRSYRAVGIDLQKEVHEDLVRDFDAYPHKWQRQPDGNIDHRRVPNLMVFFARHGTKLPVSQRGVDYSPGDIVAWDLGKGVTHISTGRSLGITATTGQAPDR